ncbi:MAG: DEAD/DEAH box helicase [Desulfovibrio sp.]|jgi:superfamily II DNA or RNA helicase/HKD family nuclease|nr:DEAD/DEAH box helicase [Desulfovibrio sp.]
MPIAEEQFVNALKASFINMNAASSSDFDYMPRMVINDPDSGRKVISELKNELNGCDAFAISVAFITQSGITPLLQVFRDLEEKMVPGKILTTNYLNFTEPKALTMLSRFSNLHIKMYDVSGNPDFHAKTYIFQKDGLYRVILGSSNMTDRALSVNHEWNVRLVSSISGDYAHQLCAEFEKLWNQSEDIETILPRYADQYKQNRMKQGAIAEFQELLAKAEQVQKLISQFSDGLIQEHALPTPADKLNVFADDLKTSFERYIAAYKARRHPIFEAATLPDGGSFKPNVMQMRFIEEIKKLRAAGEKRALLISATGTGKTYASAFAAKDILADSPHKRMLFLVHREQIAKQAIKAYQNVFGNKKTYGLLTGNSKEDDRDIVFSTIQTMSKEDVFKKIPKDEFTFIIIDEVHRAGAPGYQKVMDHFTPDFWLGMSATPERTDGFDIFSLFNHNIAYEIRLQLAMAEDLLCPFHYFGITDISLENASIDEKDEVNFSNLVDEGRVKHIIETANIYNFSGDRVKGLIFCSRNEEAKKLSEMFNERGYHTIALSGSNLQNEREDAINKLVSGDPNDPSGHYEYIFTVDIFNEGVDIREINQVIMLRPTQSAIIFVQQLGRGLRKYPNKEFVVVLDFIANYKANFLIPIALSGDRTYNKDDIRRYLMDGHKVIPGCSSINFDKIAKERIYAAIDKAKINTSKFFKEQYQLLKYKLGRIPSLTDFYEHGEVDPLSILANAPGKTYHQFLLKHDTESYANIFSEQKIAYLRIFSDRIANGKRPHEAVILEILLSDEIVTIESVCNVLKDRYNLLNQEKSVLSAFRLLCGEYSIKEEKERFDAYGAPVIKMQTPKTYSKSEPFTNCLRDASFKTHVRDILSLCRKKYTDEYACEGVDASGFVINKKYSRSDICRILNWEKDENPQNIGGYRIKYNTCPIFVTLNKKEDISSSIKYEDKFINRKTFSWMTRSNVRLDGKEPQQIIHHEDTNLAMYLFIKKSDDTDGHDFYYLGNVIPVPDSAKQTVQPDDHGGELPIVNFTFDIVHPVKEELYDYLTDGA